MSAKAAPAASGCSSGASIGWLSGNRVYAGGWITCFRPIGEIGLTVDATLTRNGVAVAYGRSDCYGTAAGDKTCSVQSPAVANQSGTQTWCSVSLAYYDGFYKTTKRECWNG